MRRCSSGEGETMRAISPLTKTKYEELKSALGDWSEEDFKKLPSEQQTLMEYAKRLEATIDNGGFAKSEIILYQPYKSLDNGQTYVATAFCEVGFGGDWQKGVMYFCVENPTEGYCTPTKDFERWFELEKQ
jgi:hypothetical protein